MQPAAAANLSACSCLRVERTCGKCEHTSASDPNRSFKERRPIDRLSRLEDHAAITNWGAVMDLGGWLRRLGLEQYEAAFRDNEIDDTVLPNLTAEDLKDLGVG